MGMQVGNIDNLMNIVSFFRGVRKWLFAYPQRIDINPHHSLTSPAGLLLVRMVAFLVLSFRYYLQITAYYSSAFNIVEYLTEFGFLLSWLFFAVVLQDYLLNNALGVALSPQLKDVIALLFEVAVCMEAVVTILFWVVLYDYTKPFQTVQFLKEVGVHGFPFLCLLGDLSLNVLQFARHHSLVVIAIGLLYLVVNVTYSLCVKPIYKPIDWVSFMSYAYVVGCLIFVLVWHHLLRKFWEKNRRPKLVDLLKVGSEHYQDFDAHSVNH